MLQGSSDGDPAAPAGFAEALSFERHKKAPFGVLFLCPEFNSKNTTHPCRSEPARDGGFAVNIYIDWYIAIASRLTPTGTAKKRKSRAQKSTPKGASFYRHEPIIDPAHSATVPACLPCRPESGCPDRDPYAPCLPCHPANNARRN